MTGSRHVAVVGAGPAGFYAAEQLLKAGFAVDMYDLLPTPFGLSARAGVAPDHPNIKAVVRSSSGRPSTRDSVSSVPSRWAST